MFLILFLVVLCDYRNVRTKVCNAPSTPMLIQVANQNSLHQLNQMHLKKLKNIHRYRVQKVIFKVSFIAKK